MRKIWEFILTGGFTIAVVLTITWFVLLLFQVDGGPRGGEYTYDGPHRGTITSVECHTRYVEPECRTVVTLSTAKGEVYVSRAGAYGRVGDAITVTLVTWNDPLGPPQTWWDSPIVKNPIATDGVMPWPR